MSDIRNLLISSGLAVAILGAPVAALAASEFHPGSGEKGVTEHPAHRTLGTDRAAVTAERNAAMRTQQPRFAPDGEASDYPAPAVKAGPGLSRAQVEQETLRALRAGEISSGERS